MLWNVASMRLLHRLGFTEEGVLRAAGYWKGAFHDLRMYALLKSEYERQTTE
jgi:ribosomal-protein-alanine N-acetyltransferase